DDPSTRDARVLVAWRADPGQLRCSVFEGEPLRGVANPAGARLPFRRSGQKILLVDPNLGHLTSDAPESEKHLRWQRFVQAIVCPTMCRWHKNLGFAKSIWACTRRSLNRSLLSSRCVRIWSATRPD